ncbi:MAG TPA: hypothetical protein VF121_09230 [Thermoanaerobaculia bacterium]|nr:hypothetical protein [Thermoanaerobaculia bacterium]
MKALRVAACCLTLCTCPLLGAASALEITYSTTGFGPVTYFAGEVQESTLTFTGSGLTGTSLFPGIPAVHPTHGVVLTEVGIPQGIFPGPTETHVVETTLTIGTPAGTRTVTLAQDATLFQVLNGQFQFDLAPSELVTLDLGAAGSLDVQAYHSIFQFTPAAEGGGTNVQIRFFLHGESAPTAVRVDVKPGSFPNTINPRSQGRLTVAILTTGPGDNTGAFDATTVDPSSVRFGATGTEAAAVKHSLRDADHDGDTDLILQFRTEDTGLKCSDVAAKLTGETFGGAAFQGSDAIATVGCKAR